MEFKRNSSGYTTYTCEFKPITCEYGRVYKFEVYKLGGQFVAYIHGTASNFDKKHKRTYLGAAYTLKEAKAIAEKCYSEITRK